MNFDVCKFMSNFKTGLVFGLILVTALAVIFGSGFGASYLLYLVGLPEAAYVSVGIGVSIVFVMGFLYATFNS